MSGIKWTRRTTSNISAQLATLGIAVGKNTVGRLLKQMDFSLRVNRKQIASTKDPDRNQQFLYIAGQKDRFAGQGLPVISVDAKKKELIGNFKNPGASWVRDPILVKDHDFRSEAKALVTPYGVYDTQANRGSVFLGTSDDTPAFAVDAISQWWLQEGLKRYPNANELLILADGGGSNASRSRAWKKAIQDHLCIRLGLTVTVTHYPPDTSKWNPIEHRLFSQISRNLAGEPLTEFDKALNFIRTTTTKPGLAVTDQLAAEIYEKGIKVTDKEMRLLNLAKHETFGRWNYTLHPTQIGI